MNPRADLLAKERKLNKLAWLASITVFFLVVLMRRYKIDVTFDFSFLPAIYSLLNVVTFFLLLAGLYFIRIARNRQLHQLVMQIAIVCSALFLILYVLYHFTTPETRYCGQGSMRYIYFFILITHIILAAIILPFILFTYIRALTQQFERHRKMARWVWPLWLYVAATGPLIYIMLRPCY